MRQVMCGRRKRGIVARGVMVIVVLCIVMCTYCTYCRYCSRCERVSLQNDLRFRPSKLNLTPSSPLSLKASDLPDYLSKRERSDE